MANVPRSLCLSSRGSFVFNEIATHLVSIWNVIDSWIHPRRRGQASQGAFWVALKAADRNLYPLQILVLASLFCGGSGKV